ncbi:AGC/MAST protein kinase [Allomyces macrogynus ATCC 38327]|uniref:non-specific serine/threonine protein kinase n=1 Tax=Allomyces macrogynus (strain ATCC 38327) TaxID=578462 RepID=A0A0L0SX01_ALLM3|nr:AGC/MAST protein kinase [Allomyces macrogynus ATCC 38327]|eukprot:KNE66935.1 AGC/MAST protein kinase [Allomyces macrogynus ATCC 38327]
MARTRVSVVVGHLRAAATGTTTDPPSPLPPQTPTSGALSTSALYSLDPATTPTGVTHPPETHSRAQGTPDYMAPELLLGTGHDTGVDYWSLGVCLFEFLCGYPPFNADSPEEIFQNILRHDIDWSGADDLPKREARSSASLGRAYLCAGPPGIEWLLRRTRALSINVPPRPLFPPPNSHFARDTSPAIAPMTGGRSSVPPRRSSLARSPSTLSSATSPLVTVQPATLDRTSVIAVAPRRSNASLASHAPSPLPQFALHARQRSPLGLRDRDRPSSATPVGGDGGSSVGGGSGTWGADHGARSSAYSSPNPWMLLGESSSRASSPGYSTLTPLASPLADHFTPSPASNTPMRRAVARGSLQSPALAEYELAAIAAASNLAATLPPEMVGPAGIGSRKGSMSTLASGAGWPPPPAPATVPGGPRSPTTGLFGTSPRAPSLAAQAVAALGFGDDLVWPATADYVDLRAASEFDVRKRATDELIVLKEKADAAIAAVLQGWSEQWTPRRDLSTEPSVGEPNAQPSDSAATDEAEQRDDVDHDGASIAQPQSIPLPPSQPDSPTAARGPDWTDSDDIAASLKRWNSFPPSSLDAMHLRVLYRINELAQLIIHTPAATVIQSADFATNTMRALQSLLHDSQQSLSVLHIDELVGHLIFIWSPIARLACVLQEADANLLGARLPGTALSDVPARGRPVRGRLADLHLARSRSKSQPRAPSALSTSSLMTPVEGSPAVPLGEGGESSFSLRDSFASSVSSLPPPPVPSIPPSSGTALARISSERRYHGEDEVVGGRATSAPVLVPEKVDGESLVGLVPPIPGGAVSDSVLAASRPVSEAKVEDTVGAADVSDTASVKSITPSVKSVSPSLAPSTVAPSTIDPSDSISVVSPGGKPSKSKPLSALFKSMKSALRGSLGSLTSRSNGSPLGRVKASSAGDLPSVPTSPIDLPPPLPAAAPPTPNSLGSLSPSRKSTPSLPPVVTASAPPTPPKRRPRATSSPLSPTATPARTGSMGATHAPRSPSAAGPKQVQCRICDEMVEARSLDEHTKMCKVAEELTLKLYHSDVQLRKKHHELIKEAEFMLRYAGKLLDVDDRRTDAPAKCHKYVTKLLALRDGYARAKRPMDDPGRVLLDQIIQIGEEKAATLHTYQDKVSSNPLLAKRLDQAHNAHDPWAPNGAAARTRRSSASSTASSQAEDPEGGLKYAFKGMSLFQAMIFGGPHHNHNHHSPLSATSAFPPPLPAPSASAVSPVRVPRREPSTSSTSSAYRRGPKLPSIDDFEFISFISRGAYGRVQLARKKGTGDLFAIKTMSKDHVMAKNMTTQILAERQALALANTPFVVKMYYALSTPTELILVMEFMIGGDLSSLLVACGGAFDEDSARFYTAEMVVALEYLHSMGITHRDVKPDNVLIDATGHIKLTDFGLAKISVQNQDLNVPGPDGPHKSLGRGRTFARGRGGHHAVPPSPLPPQTPTSGALSTSALYSLDPATTPTGVTHPPETHSRAQGTPDYMAPELLLGTGHDTGVDYWSLGVCLFEFLCGYPPFNADSPEEIFQNILRHDIDWSGADDLSPEARDLIERLLEPNPAKRFHAKHIKAHAFFHGIDWANLRSTEAPFIPKPSKKTDTGYFDARNDVRGLKMTQTVPVAAVQPSPARSTSTSDAITAPPPRSQSLHPHAAVASADTLSTSPSSVRSSSRAPAPPPMSFLGRVEATMAALVAPPSPSPTTPGRERGLPEMPESPRPGSDSASATSDHFESFLYKNVATLESLNDTALQSHGGADGDGEADDEAEEEEEDGGEECAEGGDDGEDQGQMDGEE